MNPTLLEIIQTHGNGTESTCYCELTSSSVPTGKAELKEGFFFLLVTNGTAQLADEYQTYELQPAHLVTLTPSTKCMIQATSSHFQSMLLYLKPTSLIAYPTDSHYMNNWHILGTLSATGILIGKRTSYLPAKNLRSICTMQKKCSQLLRQYSEPLMQFLSSTDS